MFWLAEVIQWLTACEKNMTATTVFLILFWHGIWIVIFWLAEVILWLAAHENNMAATTVFIYILFWLEISSVTFWLAEVIQWLAGHEKNMAATTVFIKCILFWHEISCFGIKYQLWRSDWRNTWSDTVIGSLEHSINNLMTATPKSKGPTLEAMMKSVVSAFRGFSTLAKCVPSTLEMKWTRGPTWNGCRASVTITGPWNRNSAEFWGHWNMDWW